MRRLTRRLAAGLVLAALAPGGLSAAGITCLRGVNISGAEFGDLPGRPDHDYAYPAPETFAAFGRLGMTVVRLPLRWERLQPKLNAPLDAAELARLDAAVAAAKAAGLRTIVDPHNYATYGKARVGSEAVPVAAFADLWRRLAKHYRAEWAVVFSLMNEPYDVTAASWLEASNAAIAAIRKAGATQLVLVPGTSYTGAHSWEQDLPVGNNARVMAGVVDPADNFAYDVHQYLDGDFSGRAPTCERAADAVKAVERMSAWLAAKNRRAFLGEFGTSARPECVAAIRDLVAAVDRDPAHWIGWAAWSAGERWPAAYPLKLEPGGANAALVDALAAAAAGAGAKTCGSPPR